MDCKNRVYIYSPSHAGHASAYASRLWRLAGARQVRLDAPEALADASGHVHIAEFKQAERLAAALAHGTATLSLQVSHVFPHDCPSARRQAIEAIYARAQWIFTSTPALAAEFHSLGYTSALALCDYPYLADAGLPWRKARAGGRFLAAGYQDDSTGLDRLVEIGAALSAMGRRQLMICGPVSKEDAADARAAGCIVEAGFIAEERLRQLMLGADALLMPYRKAVNSPLLNLANECGLPVLRTPTVADWCGRSDAAGQIAEWQVDGWLKLLASWDQGLNMMRAEAAALVRQGRQRLCRQLTSLGLKDADREWKNLSAGGVVEAGFPAIDLDSNSRKRLTGL